MQSHACLPLIQLSYLCTYDLYGSVRNAFDAGSIHYKGKWEPFGAQKSRNFQDPTLSRLPSNECCPHQKHYAQGRINQKIGGFVYKSPQVVSGPIPHLQCG
jgi:hypothetical protein